jgi:hypothetical protein
VYDSVDKILNKWWQVSKWELQSSDSIATYCPPYQKLTFSLKLAVVSLAYNFVFSFKLCPSISESE